jgi:hypothetical protein
LWLFAGTSNIGNFTHCTIKKGWYHGGVDAVEANGGASWGIQEAGKMAMIAFYAGLIVGIFVGCVLTSLYFFKLSGDGAGVSGHPEINPQKELL